MEGSSKNLSSTVGKLAAPQHPRLTGPDQSPLSSVLEGNYDKYPKNTLNKTAIMRSLRDNQVNLAMTRSRELRESAKQIKECKHTSSKTRDPAKVADF